MNMRFAALAAALAMTSAGCSVMKPGCGDSCGPCGDMPCHVATSQMAPRASMQQGRCRGPGIFDGLGWTARGASCGDSCGGGCGPFGCGEGYGMCNGDGESCLQNGLSTLLDCNGCQGGCNGCQGGGQGACPLTSSGDQNYNFNAGPPVGQVAYPYYTTRGPRDFLMCNPPSIGPN